ncbi:hypothetical protein DPMN_023453 [Dreissena polymorpha]|uniref:Uncharacterized protein n=1 Tax=Dreissena polymorpha TaxID=45954 RepID=A0A9D4R9X7_DREPO|nr:hypothetical protein DPMN_023453 [Dreissena polymorpha]
MAESSPTAAEMQLCTLAAEPYAVPSVSPSYNGQYYAPHLQFMTPHRQPFPTVNRRYRAGSCSQTQKTETWKTETHRCQVSLLFTTRTGQNYDNNKIRRPKECRPWHRHSANQGSSKQAAAIERRIQS